MGAASIIIPSWGTDDRVPRVVGQVKLGTGSSRGGRKTQKVLVCGTKPAAGANAGSVVPDTGAVRILDADDADSKLGYGYECNRMACAALLVPGVEVWAAPIAEAGGAAAGVLTITVGGAWTATGTVYLMLGKHVLGFAAGATVEATADNLVAAVNGCQRIFCTAAKGIGPAFVVTLTTRDKSARALEHYCMVIPELSTTPTGMTVTLAGGAPVGSGLVAFITGAGADTPDTTIALLTTERYDRIATCHNDATQLAKWVTHVNSEAGPLINHLEQLVASANSTEALALAVSKTAINAYRVEYLWTQYGPLSNPELAAYWAAYRSSVEQDNPNPNYDGTIIPTNVVGAQRPADVLLHAEKKSALLEGLTPVTTESGSAVVIRSIVTHCLTGTSADYRCYDTTDVTVPDRILDDTMAVARDYVAANPYVDEDPADEEPARPAGVATPKGWGAKFESVLRDAETLNWITDVDNNLPESEYDSIAKRIMSSAAVVVRPKNHQLGVVVSQQAA